MLIAVSACLLGEPCRYDGASKGNDDVRALSGLAALVPLCPEQLGGLATPRPPAEIRVGPDGVQRVVNAEGADVTDAFARGAEAALLLAQEQGCVAALLKEGSPSCGTCWIHDGLFSGALVPGQGLTARAFAAAGFPLFSEEQLDQLRAFLARAR